MFIIASMRDTVKIDPHQFTVGSRGFIGRLERALNTKYANKVILNLGLGICFYDFIKIRESFLLPGEGATFTKAEFRFVVFRPFIGEVLIGRVRSSTAQGLNISMEFFDDIFVPKEHLPDPHDYEKSDNTWYWQYDDENKLFIESGMKVRFRVMEEKFQETAPHLLPSTPAAGQPSFKPEPQTSSQTSAPTTPETEGDNRPPFSLIASINEQGLGCVHWWQTPEGE